MVINCQEAQKTQYKSSKVRQGRSPHRSFGRGRSERRGLSESARLRYQTSLIDLLRRTARDEGLKVRKDGYVKVDDIWGKV